VGKVPETEVTLLLSITINGFVICIQYSVS